MKHMRRLKRIINGVMVVASFLLSLSTFAKALTPKATATGQATATGVTQQGYKRDEELKREALTLAQSITKQPTKSRVRFISANAPSDSPWVPYMKAWVSRVEAAGTRDFPQGAVKAGVRAELVVSTCILKSGQLASIDIITSSGSPAVDAAAVHAVRSARPFAPLVSRDGDVDKLCIVRTFNYLHGPSSHPPANSLLKLEVDEGAPVALTLGSAENSARVDRTLDVKQTIAQAERGDRAAERVLGRMYANGIGVPQDKVQAFAWTMKAAAQGDPSAEAYLGVMYVKGLGVDINSKKGLEWIRKSSDQGSALGEFDLAYMLNAGSGSKEEQKQFRALLLKSASQHYGPADYQLGIYAFKGNGASRDRHEALRDFWKAAYANILPAYLNIANMYFAGIDVKQDNIRRFN